MHACTQLVTIDRAKDMEGMEDYNSSFSMKGICVELTVVVRPRCLVKTLTTAYPVGADLPAKLLQVPFQGPRQPLKLLRPLKLPRAIIRPSMHSSMVSHETSLMWSARSAWGERGWTGASH